MKKVLILVDIQNDFADSKGTLYVSKGEEVIPVANRLITSQHFELIIATQDQHFATHKSFASNHEGKKPGDIIDLNGITQILWANHCESGSNGADFHKNLLIGRVNLILRKGFNPEVDSYSGFYDNAGTRTGLSGYLDENDATEIYIMGLATDYCVRYTAIDAIKIFKQDYGFRPNVYLIEDGCRAVNIKSNDGQDAIDEMRKAGVEIISEKGALK